MSFVRRRINIRVQLGKGAFGESGTDTVVLSGHRVSVVINKDGAPSMNTATIRIYGLTSSLMNQISRLGQLPNATRNNIVTIEAGDEDGAMSICFAGIIMEAWPDFQGMPDVAFCMTASTSALAMVKPSDAKSFPNDADVADIMSGLSIEMGFTFENGGVHVVLGTPYLWGTARQQALSVAAAAGIIVAFDDERGIMAIMPRDGFRNVDVPLISAETGMVGYPSFAGPGQIVVRTLYNPTVRYLGRINVQTSFDAPGVTKPASGLWRVNHLTHALDAQVPNGQWFTQIVGGLYGSGRSVTP